MRHQKMIAIVGGGPIGLYTALLFAEKYSDVHIAIIEKRQIYSRSHMVQLHDCRIPCSLPPVKLDGWSSIQKIERQLKDQLERLEDVSLSVSFHQYNFTTMERFLQHDLFKTKGRYSKPELIVFASGAKSAVRDLYFGGDLYRVPYSNVCFVKYRRQCLNEEENYIHSKSVLHWNHHYRISKLIQCYFQESIQDQIVSLIIIGEFSESQLVAKSAMIINCRRVEICEQVIGRVTYAHFPLEISRSRMVDRIYMGVQMYLVGDVAAGIPFQKGLTTGFRCAKALVHHEGAAYASHFDEIIGDITNLSTFRAQTLKLYLQWTSFWQGDLLEWQRWSRPYESLLCNGDTDIYDPTLLTNPITLNRKLILEQFKDNFMDLT